MLHSGIKIGLSMLAAFIGVGIAAANTDRLQDRWVFLPVNLYVEQNVKRVEGILDRAQKAGYNGVLFRDSKTAFWWLLQRPDRWRKNCARLRQMTREREMELAAAVFPFGYSHSLLWNDANLASGMPVHDAPLVAREGVLVPVETAALRNGSFERHARNRVAGSLFQDGAGKTSFIDSQNARHGDAALRFDNFPSAKAGLGRISFRVKVRPWQQYRLRVWMKTENLRGGEILLRARAQNRWIQRQNLKYRKSQINEEGGMTMDWFEQIVAFNSQDNTEVTIYAGVWGGKSGRMWWDDLRIEAAPTLNLLRRPTLPVTMKGEDGTLFEEGRDYERVEDKKLGHTGRYPGSYDTRHDPPVIRLTPGSRIREGQTVLFSGCHTAVVYDSQVNMSLDDPEAWRICELQLTRTLETLEPDALFMYHDEIRIAGWEPKQRKTFTSTGELLAHNVRRCQELIRKHAPDKPIYVWSDMFDPHHNATKNYYLVQGDIAGSWKGLDPSVIVMKWGSGSRAKPGMEFFAGRGHPQMMAAYYDRDIERDHAMWQAASAETPNVRGVMYTTWKRDYSKLEEFAQTWWGGKP